MYPWMVYLHVIAIFGFLLAHGVSASVAFALQRERNLERVRALLELSAGSYKVMYLSLLALLVTGIISGIMGEWFSFGWIWVSLLLLAAIIVAMSIYGSAVYSGVRKGLGLPYFERGKPQPPVEPVSAEEMDALLKRGNPMILTLIGYGGFAIVTWLMMFKPF